MSDSLTELAERCERAAGPSGHLDAQIFILLDPEAQHIVGQKPGRFPQESIYGPRSSFWEWALDETKEPPQFASIPYYTGSIDAAMQLVPQGWTDIRQHQHLMTDSSVRCYAEIEIDNGETLLPYEGRAAIAPLALCAAALRARAAIAMETGTAIDSEAGVVAKP